MFKVPRQKEKAKLPTVLCFLQTLKASLPSTFKFAKMTGIANSINNVNINYKKQPTRWYKVEAEVASVRHQCRALPAKSSVHSIKTSRPRNSLNYTIKIHLDFFFLNLHIFPIGELQNIRSNENVSSIIMKSANYTI